MGVAAVLSLLKASAAQDAELWARGWMRFSELPSHIKKYKLIQRERYTIVHLQYGAATFTMKD